MKTTFAALLLVAVTASCGPAPTGSSLQEAPDFWNALSRFGFNRVFTYNDITTRAHVATPDVPWTDTYWPLSNKGLAWRYASSKDPAAADEEVKVAAYLRHYATEAAKQTPDPLLSPAEKYDLVFQYRHDLAAAPEALAALAGDLAKQDATIKAKTDLKDKKSLLGGMVASLTTAATQPALSMTFAGWSTFLSESAGEKNKYLALASSPGDDWSWEGHCHGWAPAAVMSRPPKHGVMALIGAKQVFFSEGDIRGLMTKAWADSAPGDQQYFLARRCEASPQDVQANIVANAQGRGYSGTLKDGDKTQNFIVLETLPRMTSVSLGGANTVLNFYRIAVAETGDKLYLVENPNGRQFWTVPFLSDLDDAVRSKNFTKLKAVNADLTGCWDPNPASFHAVLLEQLDERKTGFVMDRTRTAQVWNQPIYAADFTVGPMVSVDATTDAARAYRAAGTAFLVEVTAVVQWSGEPPSPRYQYPDGFDDSQLEHSVYHYTLEFDAKFRMIGGEWGTLAKLDPSWHAPDFLFGYPKGAVPVDHLDADAGSARIDYSGIIGRLHDCSTDDATDGQLDIRGFALPYKNCTINKAQ